MNTLKNVLAGFAGAILAILVVALATCAWQVDVGEGSGGIGAVSLGLAELVLEAGPIGFVLGFWWRARRQRYRRLIDRK